MTNPPPAPKDWTVTIDAPAWAEGNSDDFEDDRRVLVGKAHLSIVPDAGPIDLFDTLEAVDQILANVGEMLTLKRPDLMISAGMELGGDLLVLHSLWAITPSRFRRAAVTECPAQSSRVLAGYGGFFILSGSGCSLDRIPECVAQELGLLERPQGQVQRPHPRVKAAHLALVFDVAALR